MSIICKNCETAFDAKHCPQCGQKASVKRIKLEDFYEDSIKKLTHWDRGLARTSLDLLTKPGTMTRDYIQGKRTKYTKPLSYLFLIMAVSLIFFSPEDMMRIQKTITGQPDMSEKQRLINEWVSKHLSVITSLSIPFMALVTKWLNRKQDVNYAEHLVINTYWMAGSVLLTAPINAALKLAGVPLMGGTHFMLNYPISMLYHAWAYVYFFQKQRKWWGGLQGLWAYTLGYLLFFVSFTLIGMMAVLLYLLIVKKLLPH